MKGQDRFWEGAVLSGLTGCCPVKDKAPSVAWNPRLRQLGWGKWFLAPGNGAQMFMGLPVLGQSLWGTSGGRGGSCCVPKASESLVLFSGTVEVSEQESKGSGGEVLSS